MAAKHIKLFVDAHAFDKEFQGVRTFLCGLYTQVLADYPELDIFFGVRDVENFRHAFPGLHPERILPYGKGGNTLFRMAFDIPAYLKKHRFDFAHFQYITPNAVPGCRYIVTLHDVLFNDFKQAFTFPYRFSRNVLFGRSIRQAHIRTTVSQYARHRICSHYNIMPETVHVIPNGISRQFSNPWHSREEARRHIRNQFGINDFVLYVSRVEPRKNHQLVLETYLKLRLNERGIALVFIGEASARVPDLARLVSNLADEQRQWFHWLRQVSQSDLVAFYRACRLFVYPSGAEGFGIPPLEAAVCGAPVLCSSATAMRDFTFFEPYTFDPDDNLTFRQKMAAMIDAPPAPAFRQQAAEHAMRLYDWKHSSRSFYQLLQANQL